MTVAAPQEMADESTVAKFNAPLPFEMVRLKQFGSAPIKLGYRLVVVAALLRRIRPTLIVASGERMVWLASILGPLHRIPFVAVGHAMEFNVPARWQRAVSRRSYEAAACVVCVSQYTRSHMERFGITALSDAVIPNGADDTRFRVLPAEEARRFRQARGLEHATILITVGSVHERKGQDVVIRALPRILERFPEVHYVMAGVPYRRDRFGELAAQLGVAEHVHFLGVVDPAEVVRALNAADLFVMASQHTPNGDFEGFGIAVVEAALCGRAAVVSDNSGVVEAIEPGETGLVSTISDPVSTADRIIELLSDRGRLTKMERLATTRAAAEKTWEHRGAQYDELLRAVASGVNDVHRQPR